MVIFYFHASKEAGNCLKSIRMSQNCKISMDVAFMSPSIYKESKWHNYQKEIKKKGYYQSIYPFKTSPSLLGLAWQLSSASFVAFNASRRNSSRLPQWRKATLRNLSEIGSKKKTNRLCLRRRKKNFFGSKCRLWGFEGFQTGSSFKGFGFSILIAIYTWSFHGKSLQKTKARAATFQRCDSGMIRSSKKTLRR